MAFAQDSEVLLIKEGVFKVGVFTNPQLIGTNATSPASFFTGDIIGFIKQGTISVNINRTFAEFKSSTPAIMIRKDLIEKTFTTTFESGQFDGDSIELLKGTNSQKDFNVTIPGAETWDIHHMGSDEPVQPAQGFLLDTLLTNGDRFLVAIYSGRVLGEDISIALSGTDYAITGGEVVAFPDSNFTGVTDETQKHYGFLARRSA